MDKNAEGRVTKPGFGRIVRRDRLALAGLYLWVISGLIVVVLPLVFRNMTFQAAFLLGMFPFAVGALLILPRVRLVNRMYEHGVPSEAEVLEKRDYERRSQIGSLVTYSYTFQGGTYQCRVNTGEPLGGLAPGDRLRVLVDPAKPSRSLLPRIFE